MRSLWKVELPVDFDKRRSEFRIDVPPQAVMLEVRYDARTQIHPELWLVGDLDEPLTSREFLAIQTGEKLPPGYAFIGIVQHRAIMSFGLFIAG